MPVLDSSYISTWWYLQCSSGWGGTSYSGKNLFVENWSEKQIVELQKIPLIQGDIGTHVMNVGGTWYETTIATPILIFGALDGTPHYPDNSITAWSLLQNQFAVLQTPQSTNTAPTTLTTSFLMESATIDFKPEGTSVTIKFLSDDPHNLFTPLNNELNSSSSPGDFIARTARFYDTTFNLTNSAGYNFYILSGTITIQAVIKKNYFINSGGISYGGSPNYNTGQLPWFSLQEYKITGNVVTMARPGDVPIIPLQTSGNLIPTFTSTSTINLAISGGTSTEDSSGTANNALDYISLGEIAMFSSATLELKPDQITHYSFEFETYARRSTTVSAST